MKQLNGQNTHGPPIQKIADRLAGYLVYFALGAAVLTYFMTHNIRSTISVVIVAGACGIADGTPLAILGAIGRVARHGAIIKAESIWRHSACSIPSSLTRPAHSRTEHRQ